MSAPAAAKPDSDDRLLRTLFVGMVAGFILYGLGLVALYFIPAPTGIWVNVALTVLGLGFVIVWWYLTMRRGLRLGKPANKRETRAKQKERREREKLRALRMRR